MTSTFPCFRRSGRTSPAKTARSSSCMRVVQRPQNAAGTVLGTGPDLAFRWWLNDVVNRRPRCRAAADMHSESFAVIGIGAGSQHDRCASPMQPPCRFQDPLQEVDSQRHRPRSHEDRSLSPTRLTTQTPWQTRSHRPRLTGLMGGATRKSTWMLQPHWPSRLPAPSAEQAVGLWRMPGRNSKVIRPGIRGCS